MELFFLRENSPIDHRLTWYWDNELYRQLRFPNVQYLQY